jgi:ligand-binding SRPBCC domain-containing protein
MIHIIKQTQFLPISIDKAWDFFSTPENLNKITPDDLSFKINSELPPKVYAGQMIIYKVSPFKNIAFDWLTEITQVNEPHFFIDEQRFGPYALWHHEHHFKAVDGGVEMTDIVHYKLPFGWFGNLFHRLLVKPKLNQIFNYRLKVLEVMFNS